MAKHKYQEVANELEGDTGQVPSCIHMVSIGRTKVKFYEGGYLEVSVSGKEKSSVITVDNDGNVYVDCDGTFQVMSEDVKIAA